MIGQERNFKRRRGDKFPSAREKLRSSSSSWTAWVSLPVASTAMTLSEAWDTVRAVVRYPSVEKGNTSRCTASRAMMLSFGARKPAAAAPLPEQRDQNRKRTTLLGPAMSGGEHGAEASQDSPGFSCEIITATGGSLLLSLLYCSCGNCHSYSTVVAERALAG